MLKLPIYMDYHATTPVDPRVVQAMIPYFGEDFGNPSSRTHSFGWRTADAVQHARKQVATLIGASAKEIVFTSGATESDNLALKGAVAAARESGDHVIVAATEHPAVLDTCRRLERDGCRVTYLTVTRDGLIDLDRLMHAMTDRTILISVMAANNEIGVIQPIATIGRMAAERGVLFHTDAAQAAGRIPLDVTAMNIDLMSMSAHKMYGPKGVGALYVRHRQPRVPLGRLFEGGGQEGGMRPGTLNVPGIVGFGGAAEICRDEMVSENQRVGALRDRLHDGLRANLPEVHVNGSMACRLSNNLNLSFSYVEGETLLMALGDVAVSSGSACTSTTREPSHVLKAIGVPDDQIHASIRFGLGRFTTTEEVDYVVSKVTDVVTKLRELSPLSAPLQTRSR